MHFACSLCCLLFIATLQGITAPFPALSCETAMACQVTSAASEMYRTCKLSIHLDIDTA